MSSRRCPVAPSWVRVVCPVVVTGEVPDARAVRVLKRDKGKPLAKEGRLSSGTPEIGVGGGVSY
ncbi:hypothetical protein GCM10010193_70370 [Kitasatospora atroaurantiaca]